MMLAPVLLVAGGVVLLAVMFSARSEEPAPPIVPSVPPSVPGPSGIAPTDNEIEALARIMSSEAGDGTQTEQRAIGWTARNRFRGKSIYDVEYPWRDQKGSDPPFSSARPSSKSTIALAQEILAADQSQDPTGGATAFFEPRMQDIFFKAGEMVRAGETGSRVIDGVKLSDITRFKNYKKDAATIHQNWSHGGDTVYATAGRFEFWGSAKLFARREGTVQAIAGDDIREGRTAEDREALARAIESELGGRPDEEQLAAAWAMRNRADESGIAICIMLAPKGEYGSPQRSGGYASTRRVPTESTRAVADTVLDATGEEDPTDGAVDFWVPSAQAKMRELGDLHRAARSSGDEVKAKKYARYAGYGSEGDVRVQQARAGLRPLRVVGIIEILGRG